MDASNTAVVVPHDEYDFAGYTDSGDIRYVTVCLSTFDLDTDCENDDGEPSFGCGACPLHKHDMDWGTCPWAGEKHRPSAECPARNHVCVYVSVPVPPLVDENLHWQCDKSCPLFSEVATCEEDCPWDK